MFCCTLLYVHSSIAIILMGKRELIALLNLSSLCLVIVERLFLAVPRGCLQFVIVVFPDHTHLLFLVEIPAAFKKLSLESLHISNNKISALTDTDLAQLPNFRWIDLNGNPLAHVSPNAFKNNPRLFHINFDHTNLDHIPRAVLPLANLRSCLLFGAPIICSCDEMSYLRSWNVSDITFDKVAE